MTVDPGQDSAPRAMPIDQIQIGERGRTELGDVDALAKSIKDVGLLHPVVVTADGHLVAGERRLAAVRILGWLDVAVTVVDLDNAADALQAELEENTCRKALSAYEADVIRQKRERVLAPKAKEQQGKRTDLQPSANLAEGQPASRETRKAAAVGTGYSGSTLDKVRTIRDAAERGVVKQGKGEVPAPEPVQEIAKEAVENVKQTGAAIDREFQRVTQAIDAYVEADIDVRRAQLRKRFLTAMGRANEITTFDPSVAEVLSQDEWSDLGRLCHDVKSWHLRAIKVRNPDGKALGPFKLVPDLEDAGGGDV